MSFRFRLRQLLLYCVLAVINSLARGKRKGQTKILEERGWRSHMQTHIQVNRRSRKRKVNQSLLLWFGPILFHACSRDTITVFCVDQLLNQGLPTHSHLFLRMRILTAGFQCVCFFLMCFFCSPEKEVRL